MARCWLLSFLICLAGCSAATSPRSYLDPATAATLTVQSEPIVLAFDDQMRASNVRDYVQLAAVEINRMGTRELYLSAIQWSTIDRSPSERESLLRGLRETQLMADDRPIALHADTRALRPPGVGSRPFALPSPNAQELYFPIEKEELRAIALSTSLTLKSLPVSPADSARQFREWQNGRDSLLQFLDNVP